MYKGRPYLGAVIGNEEYVNSYVKHKVSKWSNSLEKLATIAVTQPHAAYAAFTHGLSEQWTYISRTINRIGSLLQHLESIIRSKVIPTLTGQPPYCNDLRDVLALPARLGRIALTNPTRAADAEFSASNEVTNPLKNAIIQQSTLYTANVSENQVKARNEVHKKNRKTSKQTAENLKQSLSPPLERSMGLAKEKRASTWLTSLPTQEFLHKGAFQDALSLHYNWQPQRVCLSLWQKPLN